MKSFLVTIALVILFCVFSIYQMDSDLYGFQIERLKTVAEDAANAATLCIDPEWFSKGYIVFDEARGRQAALQVIEESIPRKTYWSNNIQVEMTFIGEDTTGNGLNLTYEDPETGFTTYVTKPTVIVKIRTGKPQLRLKMFDSITSVIRIASYEYDDATI